jgi:hypothetical protein
MTGEVCSYADIFLYTCVRAVQETGGFGLLREACDGDPFNDFPIVKNIADAVGEMEIVKASNSKFSECPI